MSLSHSSGNGSSGNKTGSRVAMGVLAPVAALALVACGGGDKVGTNAQTGAPNEVPNQPVATSGTNGIDTTPTTGSTSAPETKQPSAFATGPGASCLDSPLKDLQPNQLSEEYIREHVWPDLPNFQDRPDGSSAAIAMDGHVICVFPPIK